MKPSTTLLLRGILGLIVGVVAIGWPDITVGALVIVFAFYAFITAGLEAARGFSSDSFGSGAGYVLLAVLDAAAGVAALAWPGLTAITLVLIIAVWAVIAGVAEIVLALRAPGPTADRLLLGLTGAITVALGVAFFIRPDVGALTVAEVYGLYCLIGGVAAIVVAINLKRADSVIKNVGTQLASS